MVTKFRYIVENAMATPFIKACVEEIGLTDVLTQGGLILPNGKLINIFPLNTGAHWDWIESINKKLKEYNLPELSGDDFDQEVIDNGIVRYSFKHPAQSDYIKLPSRHITKEQKDILQNILFQTDNRKIPFMVEDDLFTSIVGTKESNIDDILKQLQRKIQGEFKEGDKKVFDKKTGYNSSKDELYIFDKLKELWPDVIMSYTDDRMVNPETHRHFQVDFYVPSKDIMFNYNKHWTHFSEPYNTQNPEHKKDVAWLKAQEGDFYKKTLNKWTINDPLKRELAKQNNIRFIEWFNLEEFNNWLKNPQQTYEQYKAPNPRQYDSEDYFKQKAQGKDPRGLDSQPFAD